jgi:GxxExxY protein
MLKQEDLTERIIGTFYDVYNELGHGFLESIYEKALLMVLTDAGFAVCQQKPIPVHFHGKTIGNFFADLVVENEIVLELKAARSLDKAHEAQLLHYLRATEMEVGLLLNFGERPQFKRLLYENNRKRIRGNPCESAAN